MTKELDKHAAALLVQKHQLDNAQTCLGAAASVLDSISCEQSENLNFLDQLLEQAQEVLDNGSIVHADSFCIDEAQLDRLNNFTRHERIEVIEYIGVSGETSWDEYFEKVGFYADEHDIDLREDPYRRLMSDSQRIALEKRIKEDFSLKNAACDKYDYMLASACGLIGGLIDVFFVGVPGQGALGKWTDVQVDNAVKKFASLNGWSGGKRGGSEVASAIGFLEEKFNINYDHATTAATDGAVKNMSMRNHHVKSLGHSPDLVGLFFSILDQFSSTAHFVDRGKLISIDTKTFELSGGNFPAKLFAGFANWLGHLF